MFCAQKHMQCIFMTVFMLLVKKKYALCGRFEPRNFRMNGRFGNRLATKTYEIEGQRCSQYDADGDRVDCIIFFSLDCLGVS